jgi:L-malate glycosyltransferase
MRFCLVSTQEFWGGGEELLWTIACELQLAGHSVCWIAREKSEIATRIVESQFQVLHLTSGRGANLVDWFATRRVLREWSPDVVLLNDTHAVPLAGSAAIFCRRPKPLRLAYKHTVFPLRSGLKYRMLADKLICVSSAAEETVLRGGLPQEHSLVIYGGCRPPQEQPSSRARVRQELGLKNGTQLLVAIGNLLDCKGHAELVQAAYDLRRTHPQFLVVIAGEGAERERLERQISNLGLQDWVRLLGYRNDAIDLMAAADLVVHPSHAEGLSLVLIQAQMLCKPIVATAVGGTVEVLQSNDSLLCTSWIANARDPQSLAEQIRQALAATATDSAGLVQKLALTAQRTQDLFDIRTNTQQLVDVSSRLIKTRA